jgi:hypothetical protein
VSVFPPLNVENDLRAAVRLTGNASDGNMLNVRNSRTTTPGSLQGAIQGWRTYAHTQLHPLHPWGATSCFEAAPFTYS